MTTSASARAPAPWAALAGLALGAAACLATVPAAAQGGATGSLGKGTGPIMTLEELRACIGKQADLNRRGEALPQRRQALEQERAAIEAENKALADLKGSVEEANAKVEAFNARQKDVAAQVQDWNQRWADFESAGRTGPMAERQRRKLMAEQEELKRNADALKAEAAGVSAPADLMARLSARSDALARRVDDWNKESAAISGESVKLTDERELWTIECGNRRYLTDDEKVIRGGQ